MAQARFIAETARMPFVASEKPLFLPEPSEPAFEGVEAVPLLRSPLTEYLKERGIPYAVASRHCCRLNYGVRGKRYFAVGFPNVSGGYETRSRRFKGCVPPKDVSLVKAGDIPADVCSVFEGFMDFLSAVTLGLATGDCLVLNSVANVEKALKHLDGYADTLRRKGDRPFRHLSRLQGLERVPATSIKKTTKEQQSKNQRIMNILNNKNKRTSIFKALALCLFAAVSFTFVSCDDDMDIQQSYPFTVETMPVPNKVTKGQTVEIRCELKKTGDFANTLYTIRYFQNGGRHHVPAQ